MIEKMLMIIASMHDGQVDKAGAPYVLHPIKVMSLLMHKKDEELMLIALGHDLIEDTLVTEEYLREEGFSKRVIDGIVALTKVEGETYEEYKAKVMANDDAVEVKWCDLEHNVDTSRFNRPLTDKENERTMRYYDFMRELSNSKIKGLVK